MNKIVFLSSLVLTACGVAPVASQTTSVESDVRTFACYRLPGAEFLQLEATVDLDAQGNGVSSFRIHVEDGNDLILEDMKTFRGLWTADRLSVYRAGENSNSLAFNADDFFADGAHYFEAILRVAELGDSHVSLGCLFQ